MGPKTMFLCKYGSVFWLLLSCSLAFINLLLNSGFWCLHLVPVEAWEVLDGADRFWIKCLSSAVAFSSTDRFGARFFRSSFHIIVLTMPNACAITLIIFPYFVSLKMENFSPIGSSLVYILVYLFFSEIQSSLFFKSNAVFRAFNCYKVKQGTRLANKKHLSVTIL